MALLTNTTGEWIRLLLSNESYKPGKGMTARLGSLAGVIVVIVFGVYSWSQLPNDPVIRYFVPVLVGSVLSWVAYRLIHYPKFADFLINTEAEMNKVTWPSYHELYVSTIVVVVLLVISSVFLFATDVFWIWLLRVLGISRIGWLLGGG